MAPELIFVPTEDGWTLALHRYAPLGPRRACPVVMLHGMGANRAHFDLGERHSLARAAQARGFEVWVVELRGAGRSRAPGGRSRALYQWGFADFLERDVPTALSFVLERSGSAQAHMVGHSMGGMLCYAMGVVAGARLRSIVTLGSPLVVALDLGSRARRLLQLAASLGPVTTFTPSPQRRVPLRRVMGAAARLGVWSSRLVDDLALNVGNCELAVLTELARHGIDDVPIRLVADLAQAAAGRGSNSPFAYEAQLGQIVAPTLVMGGAIDRIATPSSVAAVVARLAPPELRWQMLGRAQGALEDYGHVDLLIGRHAPEEVYLPVVTFLMDQDGGAGALASGPGREPGPRAAAGLAQQELLDSEAAP